MTLEFNHHYNVDIIPQDASIGFKFSLIEDINEPQLEVYIKWDGCANIGSGTDGVLIHTCGRLMLEDTGKLLNWAYDYTKQNLKGFSD
jgi:hypothetical protein